MMFARYIFIQILAYVIDMGVFLTLIYLGLSGPIISNVLGKIAAGTFAFLAHRNFTFCLDKDKRNGKQPIRYILLLGLNVPVSTAALGLILFMIDSPVIAKLSSDVVVVLLTFWLSKTWVFVPDGKYCSSSSRNKISP